MSTTGVAVGCLLAGGALLAVGEATNTIEFQSPHTAEGWRSPITYGSEYGTNKEALTRAAEVARNIGVTATSESQSPAPTEPTNWATAADVSRALIALQAGGATLCPPPANKELSFRLVTGDDKTVVCLSTTRATISSHVDTTPTVVFSLQQNPNQAAVVDLPKTLDAYTPLQCQTLQTRVEAFGRDRLASVGLQGSAHIDFVADPSTTSACDTIQLGKRGGKD